MSDHESRVRKWSPAAGLVGLAWVGGLAAVAWCGALFASGADPAGRLIAGCAAVGLLTAALYGTRARPRLRADVDGLTIGGLLRTQHHPWPLVQEVRVLRVRRWGRESALLEVETITADGGERLLVFGRLDLNADPEDVAPDLRALRPT